MSNSISIHGGLSKEIVLNHIKIIYKLVKSNTTLTFNREIKKLLNPEVAKMNVFKIYYVEEDVN